MMSSATMLDSEYAAAPERPGRGLRADGQPKLSRCVESFRRTEVYIGPSASSV